MKMILTLFILISTSAYSAENCAFNFKDFHSLLIQNSKKYTKIKPEVKDEISKTVTQQTRLKSGEELLFLGGGCAHFNYSLIFSKIKFKTDKVQEKFKKARDLVAYIDVQKGYTDVLIRALDEAMKKPIQKSKTGVHDLPCGDAICTLDISSKNSLKLNYSFAL